MYYYVYMLYYISNMLLKYARGVPAHGDMQINFRLEIDS
jgi:hypothetical protein